MKKSRSGMIHDVYDCTDPMKGVKLGSFEAEEDAKICLKEANEKWPNRDFKMFSFVNPCRG